MAKRKIRFLNQKKHTDWWLVVFAVSFSLLGLLMIFESSNVSAYNDFGDKYHFVKDQLKGLLVGLSAMAVTLLFPYRKYYKLALPLFFITIIILLSVYLPGIGIKAYGARRWVSFHAINFQPSELAKLTMTFYLAAWLSVKEKQRLFPFFLLLGLIVGLIALQPDLGTSIIITSIAVIIYFLSGAPVWNFLMLVPVFIGSIVILAITSAYRLKRLVTFLNPGIDPLGASYHIRQILISLGSGGFWGVGLGNSRQKYQFLPEASTDSIFAIIGEEFGFIGAFIFVSLFLIFLYRIYKIARNTPDRFSYLLVAGILALFCCQLAVNLGAIVAILPLTGVPLPFISYGGSNLVISLAAVGIIINITRHSNDRI